MIADPALFAAYVAAAFVVLVIPGPTILTVVAYGLSHGPRAAWASASGVAAGDALAVTVSLTGLGALMAISPSLFNLVKWIGAAYLLWLSIGAWRESNQVGSTKEIEVSTPESLQRVFRQTFIVTALNPKGIVFIVAFIPQFVVKDEPYWPQVTLFGAIFVVLGALNALAYAYSAGHLAAFFTQPGPMRWMKRLSAFLLGGAAVYTALAQIKV